MKSDVMDISRQQRTEKGIQRLETYREELVERILRAVPEDGVIQPLPGLYLGRVSVPLKPVHSVIEPSFCVIAQGSKEILLAGNSYRYDPSHYLIATVELPRISQVLEASREKPYLSFRLVLSPNLVGSVIMEAGLEIPSDHPHESAMDVGPMDVNLQDAVVRLVRLLDNPGDAQVLMPLITREIVYWLLAGTQAARLRHLATMEGYTPLITRAVARLREDISQPQRIEDLAHELGMSASGLHHHFKAITSMSPLQFQKQLRLQEARRLMLSENLDAVSTAYRLGYHDAAHFNREYKSIFGLPPARDIQQLKQAVMESNV